MWRRRFSYVSAERGMPRLGLDLRGERIILAPRVSPWRICRVKAKASSADVPLRDKIREGSELLRGYVAQFRQAPDLTPLFNALEEYDELLSIHGTRNLRDARVFEIGFGTRPYRLILLRSLDVDACGVDIEVPVLKGTPSEFETIYRKNGVQRLAKSLVRYALFDPRVRSHLRKDLEGRGFTLRIEPERFLVGDAAGLTLPDDSFDLIFSEDVFEHISETSLKLLLSKMERWLAPNGVALIRPTIFTGITGGHLVEWYGSSLGDPTRVRRSEPWEHLRKNRFRADTYLNEFTRADYRELFLQHFVIADEVVKVPNLGREFWSAEVAKDLADYPKEELFSNQVLFVLRHRTAA